MTKASMLLLVFSVCFLALASCQSNPLNITGIPVISLNGTDGFFPNVSTQGEIPEWQLGSLPSHLVLGNFNNSYSGAEMTLPVLSFSLLCLFLHKLLFL